jgi:hypothetical protein
MPGVTFDNIAPMTDHRRAAIAWLTNQLRWERTLDLLRSEEDRTAEQAA